jgi:uncharacterized protein YbgA (DUF1722 family)
VLARYPLLPVEDELRLNNLRIRDHFMTTLFTLAAFSRVEETGDREALARFHASAKLLLLACNQERMREMGRLVASRAGQEVPDLFARYRPLLCAALSRVPRFSGNINVLQHAMGYFRDRVPREEREYCIMLIERYRQGHATLAEARNLVHAWAIRFDEPALRDQLFFAPYPAVLTSLPGELTDRGRDVWKSRNAS